MGDYTAIHATPDVDTYISLRASTGLTPKTLQAATVGLANTLFAVQITRPSVGIQPIEGRLCRKLTKRSWRFFIS